MSMTTFPVFDERMTELLNENEMFIDPLVKNNLSHPRCIWNEQARVYLDPVPQTSSSDMSTSSV